MNMVCHSIHLCLLSFILSWCVVFSIQILYTFCYAFPKSFILILNDILLKILVSMCSLLYIEIQLIFMFILLLATVLNSLISFFFVFIFGEVLGILLCRHSLSSANRNSFMSSFIICINFISLLALWHCLENF